MNLELFASESNDGGEEVSKLAHAPDSTMVISTKFEEATKSIPQALGPGAMLLPGFVKSSEIDTYLLALQSVITLAPLRTMRTASGLKMSVDMTNCGRFGWTSDRSGYHYTRIDPNSGKPWPAMPTCFQALATEAAHGCGYPGFVPDACLINRYEVKSKLSLHQDRNESDLRAPIVSVSLGIPATFQFGGLSRQEPCLRIQVQHRDVVVWGGESRLAYHGIAPLADGFHPQFGRQRINLTFREVG